MKSIKLSILITLSLAFSFSFFLTSCSAQKTNKSTKKEEVYIPLSEEKFKEIETAMNKQEDWNPIRLEGFTKSELVSFYIKSYDEQTISTWADWAHKKMYKFPKSKPTEEQEVKFQELLNLPKNAENMYKFMMLMSLEQIETVGY